MSGDQLGLNIGIRKTVALLQAAGFNTCDSGDGETHDHDCDRESGYVSMTVEPLKLVSETVRLHNVLRAAGVKVLPIGFGDGPWIQGTLDPVNMIAVLDVDRVHDRLLAVLQGGDTAGV